MLFNKSSSDSHIISWTVPAAYDGSDLDLAYSYRCSGSGNFILNTDQGSYLGDDDPFYVNELDDHGSGMVTASWAGAGLFRVQVLSECRWTIKVTAIPVQP